MKIYTVYHNPNAKTEEDSIALVPEDFSWWCFFFPFNIIWGIKNRCWLFSLLCTALFALYIVSWVAPFELSTYINITKLPAQMFLGLFANDFLRLSLQRKGFEFIDITSGKHEDEALHSWLNSHRTIDINSD